MYENIYFLHFQNLSQSVSSSSWFLPQVGKKKQKKKHNKIASIRPSSYPIEGLCVCVLEHVGGLFMQEVIWGWAVKDGNIGWNPKSHLV